MKAKQSGTIQKNVSEDMKGLRKKLSGENLEAIKDACSRQLGTI